MNNPEPQQKPPPRKRRWFQYGLRTLLVVIVLASVAMSWLAVRLHQARQQRRAVEAIVREGGSVGYDYQYAPSGNRISGGKPNGPAWLRGLLGDDLFAPVVHATVNNDASLAHLEVFEQLRDVNLHGPITDDGLKHLQDLTQLENLYLYELKITDTGLEHLKKLTRLEELYLNGTLITDLGLEHLKGMTRLQTLVLDDTQITDAGLEHLDHLHQLERLFLVDVQVTDEGVEKLQQALPDCQIVGQMGTGFVDSFGDGTVDFAE